MDKAYENLTHENWNVNIKSISNYSSFNDAITPHFVKILELIKGFQINTKLKQWQIAFDQHMKVVI